MREIPQRFIIDDELVFWNSLSVPLDHVILDSCFVFLKQLGVSQESLLQQLQSSFCQDPIVRKFRYWLPPGKSHPPTWLSSPLLLERFIFNGHGNLAIRNQTSIVRLPESFKLLHKEIIFLDTYYSRKVHTGMAILTFQSVHRAY